MREKMKNDTYPKLYLYKRIVQAKLFIDRNFSEKIDLDQIADEAYFSKYHFLRLFKQAYGKTPHQYLVWVRMEHAQQLIKTGAAISDVCYATGFDSPGSFSMLFRRTTGDSPTAYQAMQLQQRADIRTEPLRFIPQCFASSYGWVSAATEEVAV
jgi:AraC-like DNA-binding protein